MVDGVPWYRLRAGPFLVPARRRAQLRAAQERYPTAWLAIDDEQEEAQEEDGGLESRTKVTGGAAA